MIFNFLNKQKNSKTKLQLIKVMINSVNIPEKNKELYLEALDVLDLKGLDNLYNELVIFTKNYELKELSKINEENFASISGMKKKEAIEKQKEINAFSFLINNI